MDYTAEQIADMAESLYFRYAGEFLGFLFKEKFFEILPNINTLEGIPMSWIEAWEMDGRRGFLGKWIERQNARRFEELSVALEQRNPEFVEAEEIESG